jgi:hypothetical protein
MPRCLARRVEGAPVGQFEHPGQQRHATFFHEERIGVATLHAREDRALLQIERRRRRGTGPREQQRIRVADARIEGRHHLAEQVGRDAEPVGVVGLPADGPAPVGPRRVVERHHVGVGDETVLAIVGDPHRVAWKHEAVAARRDVGVEQRVRRRAAERAEFDERRHEGGAIGDGGRLGHGGSAHG